MRAINKSIVISEELKEKAQKIAEQKGLSLNALIRLALSEYIERNS